MQPSVEDLVLRPETPRDRDAVDELLSAAFGGDDETHLVRALRGESSALSIVAALPAGASARVVGHVMFSPCEPERPATGFRGMALAPLAVHPDVQRRGIGGALVRHGLEACSADGVGLVVLLGDPEYYPRFGFEPGARHGISCRWSSGEAFQVLELTAGHARLARGEVRYHAHFDALG